MNYQDRKGDQRVVLPAHCRLQMTTSRDICPVILVEPRKTWFYIKSFLNHWSHYMFARSKRNSCVRISHWCENSKHFPFTSLFHWKLDHHRKLFVISLVFLSIIATLSNKGVTMNNWNRKLLLNFIKEVMIFITLFILSNWLDLFVCFLVLDNPLIIVIFS